VPFERLASEPEFAAYSQKAGFYQGLFSFQDARERISNWGGLAQENLPVMQGGATEDFGLWLMESAKGLTGGINFNADLFTRDTAVMFRKRILGLLRDAVARPDAKLRDLLAAPTDHQREFQAWRDARNNAASQATSAAPAARDASSGSDKSAAETALAQIWSGLLGIDATQIASTDNFFDLGGSSLLAMQAVAEMESKLGQKIDPRRYVYEALRQLAVNGDAGAATAAATADSSGLAGVWAELLGLDVSQIQPGEHFLDPRGNSVLAMRAVALGEQRLNLRIDPRRYVYESLRQLASPAADAAPAPSTATAKTEAPMLSRLFGRFGRGKS